MKPEHSNTLVFIGAHPDDETFGMGGTLARYAAAGVNVYYICATRGEAGSLTTADLRGFDSVAAMRTSELECAAGVLGLSGVFYLDYRDSGMEGTADNNHPQAFCNAPVDEAAGRIVKLLRELRPQVVVTHDPIGGYRHPDHIAAHRAAVEAFAAAGNPARYPEAGPAFAPQKLYYHTMSHTAIRIAVKLMPLFGRDPHKFGRNGDIDLTKIIETEFPVHCIVTIPKEAEERRRAAARCHISQTGGEPPRRGILGIVSKVMGPKDHYMRAVPPFTAGPKERDLFADLE